MWKHSGTISRSVCYNTLSDLVGKVERTARKKWITQEMISKMDE
jgi:hypothetical protein